MASEAIQYRRAWWRIAPLTVLVVVLAGMLSGFVSGSGYGNHWFDALRKPSFMPPGWTFGAVWTALYVILGIAWAMILSLSPTLHRLRALILFYGQLGLNFAWSPIFFAVHDIDLAKYVIVAMFLVAAAAAGYFFTLRRVAGLLLVPYLAWLVFATVLNVSIQRLNPAAGTSLLTLTESEIDAVREQDDRRSGQDDERLGRDDRRDGPGGRGLDSRQGPRMDQRRRSDRPR
ncbi:MAG TPA: tryptophan-rich sensory protein [Sphingomicrobium sp.]|nr:tryptophan-rich sensory protein [Sphingomicrobium sp.]